MPCLDPESVRAEIAEAPESHDLSPERAAAIASLSDAEIASWINELAARDDAFWAAYDELRRTVIAKLDELVEHRASTT